jgi:hypothetical protein
MKYNHMIDFAAEVINNDESGVSAPEAREALRSRIDRLTDAELLEAIDICDTNEEVTP